jgi:hypothetical protein
MYILTLWSWSNWYQYMRPSLSRPIGWRRMVSASSSLIIVLNLRLSSNWHSQRYWKIVTTWLKISYKYFSTTTNDTNTEFIPSGTEQTEHSVYSFFTILSTSELKKYVNILILHQFRDLTQPLTHKSNSIFFFCQYWGLNSGPSAC